MMDDGDFQDDQNQDYQDEGFVGEQSQKPYGPQKKFRNNYRNDRYNNAYGDYSGGYGPPVGGYGRNFGNFGNFGPPRNYGPPRPFGPMPGGPPPMFHPGPPGPPGNFMWGRGFGPGGPPNRRQPMDDKTIRYLLRCGVPKEYVKNLPRDLLQLIEPEYCGLCAQSFDSFAMSRMHYVSKNHLRNQKKWLTQQSDIGYRRGKEIPLKARELYCELCDVHITSKTHSESHYAGKPHRAIVEGRKNPRNPFLVQEGMEDRVEQLIRREKKCMKSIEGEEVSDKEVKSTQPELYCDICKTSVTCSEQMTMHLNGKRHLSKEKQHILKMMKGGVKGGVDQEESEETQNEESSMEVQNESTEAHAQVECEDSYDWGNGEEQWEETKEE